MPRSACLHVQVSSQCNLALPGAECQGPPPSIFIFKRNPNPIPGQAIATAFGFQPEPWHQVYLHTNARRPAIGALLQANKDAIGHIASGFQGSTRFLAGGLFAFLLLADGKPIKRLSTADAFHHPTRPRQGAACRAGKGLGQLQHLEG